MSIESIIDGVIKREGSAYTNNPADSGGPTKYGITQAALASYRGYDVSPGQVELLEESEARDIYYRRYVKKPGFDRVYAMSKVIAEELVDAGVNVGPPRAIGWLQEALNGLNNGGRHYADVAVDMNLGPATLTALKAFLTRRGAEGEKVLYRALNGLQCAYYIRLSQQRPKDEGFLYGWIKERVQ